MDSSESATDGRPGGVWASPNGLASPALLCIETFSAPATASSDGENGRVPMEAVCELRGPVWPMRPPRESTELSPFHRRGPFDAPLLVIVVRRFLYSKNQAATARARNTTAPRIPPTMAPICFDDVLDALPTGRALVPAVELELDDDADADVDADVVV